MGNCISTHINHSIEKRKRNDLLLTLLKKHTLKRFKLKPPFAFNNILVVLVLNLKILFLELMDKSEINDWTKEIEKRVNNSFNMEHKHQQVSLSV
jgi:hypothetical protein